MLQQLCRTRSHTGVPRKTSLQEIYSCLAQLVSRRELWRIALRNVVHDGPLVVKACPGPATCRHLENHAAERPDVNSTEPSAGMALDNFRRHIHRRTGHGVLATLTRATTVGGHCLALTSDDLRGTEIYELDDAVLVKQDI